jgi:hypothetical protein
LNPVDGLLESARARAEIVEKLAPADRLGTVQYVGELAKKA